MQDEMTYEERVQRYMPRTQYELADWVSSLAPWQVISHMTFAWCATADSAVRCYERFMREHMRGVSYFYALEENPGREGFHIHALWCDCAHVERRLLWREWFGRYGRARLEPVRVCQDVADYCAKECTKRALSQCGWWNVKLLGTRHPAIRDFKLVAD